MYSVFLLAAILTEVVLSQPSDSSKPQNGDTKPSIIHWGPKTVVATPADYMVISKEIPNTSQNRIIVHVLYRNLGGYAFTEIDRYVSRFPRYTPRANWIAKLGMHFGSTKGVARYPEVVSDKFDFYTFPPNATVTSVPYIDPEKSNKHGSTWSQKWSQTLRGLSSPPQPLSQVEMDDIQEEVETQLKLRYRYEYQREMKNNKDLAKEIEEHKVSKQVNSYLDLFSDLLNRYKLLPLKMIDPVEYLESNEKKLSSLERLDRNDHRDVEIHKVYKDTVRVLKELEAMIISEDIYKKTLNELYAKMDEIKIKYPQKFQYIGNILQFWQGESTPTLLPDMKADMKERAMAIYEKLLSRTKIQELLKSRVSTMPKYLEAQNVLASSLEAKQRRAGTFHKSRNFYNPLIEERELRERIIQRGTLENPSGTGGELRKTSMKPDFPPMEFPMIQLPKNDSRFSESVRCGVFYHVLFALAFVSLLI